MMNDASPPSPPATADRPPFRWRSWLKFIPLLVLLGVAVTGISPNWQKHATNPPETKDLSNGKQIRLALALYADDHDQKLPDILETLVPADLPAGLPTYRYIDPQTKRRFDWLYFPKATGQAPKPRMILAGPLPFPAEFRFYNAIVLHREYHRVVIYDDGSGAAVPDADFTAALAREMRASNPATP